MEYNTDNDYRALAGWLQSRLDKWRDHRDINYLQDWDEYYRLWRGIWEAEERSLVLLLQLYNKQ